MEVYVSLGLRRFAYFSIFDVQIVVAYVGVVGLGISGLCKSDDCSRGTTHERDFEQNAASNYGSDVGEGCILGDVEQLNGTKRRLLGEVEAGGCVIKHITGCFVVVIVIIQYHAGSLERIVCHAAPNIASALAAYDRLGCRKRVDAVLGSVGYQRAGRRCD